jgi:kumamolisin
MLAASVKSGLGPQAIPDGAGQKIGLLEFDAFNQSDIVDYLALFNAPPSLINNLSVVPVNGGVSTPGSGESEVLLDIDTVMTIAPGAKVAVYEAPFTGQAANYATVLNAMINDGVTVISNSWASCEDQVSQADARSIDSVLQSAAAAGISVFNGTGDSGSTCLDGSSNTISVPADSPNATAVGGTSWPNGYGPGFTYGGETWWDGSAGTPPSGQGGFGVSKYFSQPSYQTALGNSAMRSVPDVVIRADPAQGVVICQADNGGCPNGSLNGGTSLAAPEWAAIAALLNQTQGKKLGALNLLLYPLAATDAFHSASSMGSDFQHVGLGSPNVNVLNRLLSGQTVGAPDLSTSTVTPLVQPGSAISSTTSS